MVGLQVGSTVERLERSLDEARGYREAMWAESEATAAYGGRSHLDRLAAYGAACQSCRMLVDALSEALTVEALSAEADRAEADRARAIVASAIQAEALAGV